MHTYDGKLKPKILKRLIDFSLSDFQIPIRDIERLWVGYAGEHLPIKTLKPYQLQALHAYSANKDALIIQATSSGKSLCFQIPSMMLQESEFGIILVPTISLAESHREAFDSIKVPSVFLNGSTAFKILELCLNPTEQDADRSKVFIMTPETLFGSSSTTGLLDQLKKVADKMRFIAIDEVHLVLEWATFRDSLNEVQHLKNTFECLIFALTATLKPESVRTVLSSILRDHAVVIKGSIDRPNVQIIFASYTAKNKVEEDKEWEETANQIVDIVEDHQSIVFTAWGTQCDGITKAVLRHGVKAECYTGKLPLEKKKQIYSNMSKKDTQILVATKSFGTGVNLRGICRIIHVGLPENIPQLVQEIGRAGRAGEVARAHLLICEYLDMKKLNFWLKNLSDKEKHARINDFKDVYLLYSSIFAGACIRNQILHYFEDENRVPDRPALEVCCTGCDIQKHQPFQENEMVAKFARILQFLKGKGIKTIHEKQLITWVRGDCKSEDAKWIVDRLHKKDLTTENSFGVGMKSSKAQNTAMVKGILLQMLFLKYVELDFKPVKDQSNIMKKDWSLTEAGYKVASGELKVPPLPDHTKVFDHLNR